MKFASAMNGISTLALVCVAVVVVSSSSKLPGGYRTYSVLTGSMEPAIPVDALILTKQPTSAEDVEQGDVISFQQPGAPDRIITHRVSEVEAIGATQFFRTKGDANSVQDAWRVSFGQITGKYVLSIPFLGSLLALLRSPLGLAVLVWLPVLTLAFHELYTIHTILAELQLEKQRLA